MTTFRPKIAGQWDTHQHWVDTASRTIGEACCPLDELGHPIRAVCIDSKGWRLTCGADFALARKRRAFPVYYFWECEPCGN